MDVLENVMQPIRLAGISKKEAKIKAEDALKKVNMENRANRLPKNLNGGQA
jgi:ABC-type polar amino acid transport system ATPase subunit